MLVDEHLPDPDALLVDDPYAEWALTARERAYDDVRLLEEMKVELLPEHGRPQDALDALLGLFNKDPTSEETGRWAMEVAWQLGRRRAVETVFHRMRTALLDELGVEPSRETLTLYQRIGDTRTSPARLIAPPAASHAGVPHRAVFPGATCVAQPTGLTDAGASNRPSDDETIEPERDGAGCVERSLLGHPPACLTRFVGRETELLAVEDALQTTRLLTLHGPGGTGKTRLAWEVVGRVQSSYPDGVGWIDLAAVHDGRLVPQTLAAALLVRENPGLSLLGNICEGLRARAMLVVLDNCEHIAAHVSQLVDTLLQACPQVRFLVTSQVPLGVPGEKVYTVPPLPVPAETAALNVDDIANHGSVALFVDRAVAIRDGFRLTPQNAASVARICRRLDGPPSPSNWPPRSCPRFRQTKSRTGWTSGFNYCTAAPPPAPPAIAACGC